MARIVNSNKRAAEFFDDDGIVEELGAETEAEKQLKIALEKQLQTRTTLQEQFSQHRRFVTPSTYKSLAELTTGVCSAEQFRNLEENEDLHQELQRCGLSEGEIEDYLAFKAGKYVGNRLVDPAIFKERINQIEDKVKAHHEALQQPESFRNAKKLTRHEMEIERSLYAGCVEKAKLVAPLVTTGQGAVPSCLDGAFAHVQRVANELRLKNRRKKKKIKEFLKPENEEKREEFVFDSNVHHVTVPLQDSDVADRKLNVEEIRELPRFENYQPGTPSRVLFLKNLHAKTTVPELRSLFGRFEEENGTFIEYKVCTGRMRGQAFIEFTNQDVAIKALESSNGFVLRGKPIIIEFGKKT